MNEECEKNNPKGKQSKNVGTVWTERERNKSKKDITWSWRMLGS